MARSQKNAKRIANREKRRVKRREHVALQKKLNDKHVREQQPHRFCAITGDPIRKRDLVEITNEDEPQGYRFALVNLQAITDDLTQLWIK